MAAGDSPLDNSQWQSLVSNPMKMNMEPKNGGLEDDFAFQLGDF